MPRIQPMAVAPLAESSMGITCLQWEPDGDLSQADRTLILSQLCRADPEVCGSLETVPWPNASLGAHGIAVALATRFRR